MALGSFLLFANLYLFQPILPNLALELSLSPTQVNWVFALTTLTLALSLIFWAVISDTFGRKKIMLLGLFLPVLIHGFLLLQPSFTNLLIARALMGVALGAFASIAMAYMVEELSPSAFAIASGNYIAANSLGGIAGRLCGGILTDLYDWQTAVWVLSIATLAGALLLLKALPRETYRAQQTPDKTPDKAPHQNPSKTQRRPSLSQIKQELTGHLSNFTIWFAMLIGGLNFALFVNLFSVIGFRLTEAPFSLPTSVTSLVFLCYLTGTISSKYSGKWARKGREIPSMLKGIAVAMAGLFLAWFNNLFTIILSLLLISGGAFFVHALAYAWVSAKATTGRATASALYLMHYYIGGSLGGFLLLYCWDIGGWLAVIAGSMLLFSGMLGLAVWLKDKEEGRREKGEEKYE